MAAAGNILATLGLACLLGGMLFFGAIVAPLVFSSLPPDIAGPFIREVFPRYYAYCAACAGLAALGFLGRGQTSSALVMLLITAALLWAWFWLIPHLNAWRAAGETAAFNRGHEISTWANAAEFFAGLWLLIGGNARADYGR